MPDREKVIKGLECCKRKDGNECKVCPYTESDFCVEDMVTDALSLLKEDQHQIWEMQELNEYLQDKLKEQEAVEPKQGEWIYCEDASGQDGYKCSECGFFEPWYYGFENHNFITDYAYCPSCGKPMQEGR